MDLSSVEFAVVDVETTGSGLNRGDRVMEVAVVHVQGSEAITALDMLVNPQRPISPFVERLTGIRWDTLHERPTFADVAPLIAEALAGRVFVAHNVRFDWRFLSMEIQRVTGRPLSGAKLCTVKMARRLVPHLARRNLDTLAWHYDVSIIGRHRAGGDARATARVLQHLLRDAHRQGIDTMDHLQSFLRLPKARPKWSALPGPVSEERIA
jgi:DNA polymerase-3 subunit epsilon